MMEILSAGHTGTIKSVALQLAQWTGTKKNISCKQKCQLCVMSDNALELHLYPTFPSPL